jgi:hypothetical protein
MAASVADAPGGTERNGASLAGERGRGGPATAQNPLRGFGTGAAGGGSGAGAM